MTELRSFVRWFARHAERHRLLGLAAEAAFWLFLSLLPLAAVGGMIAAKITVGDRAVLSELLTSVPPTARDLVAKELWSVAAWNGGSVGPTAAAVFVWLASSGVHGVFDAFDAEAGVDRSWWRKRALALCTCLVLSLAMASLAWVLLGAQDLGSLLAPRVASVWHVLTRVAIGVGVIFVLVEALYVVGVPSRARRSMRLWPGALLATGLQVTFGFGYARVVRMLGDASAYQAGLAGVAITMTALYLFMLSLLVGLSVNGYLGRQHHRAPPQAPA